MRVIIDPRSDFLYSSFYINGLTDLFGERNIVFSARPFRELPVSRKFGYPNLNFVIRRAGEKDRNFTVQVNDTWKLNHDLYTWCDVYGHVNANFRETPKEQYPKLVSLAPSFGIRCWSATKTITCSVLNFFNTQDIDYLFNTSLLRAVRKHFGVYKRLLQRCELSDYHSTISSAEDYVFHLSTLWYSDQWNRNDEGMNRARANFIRACKSVPALNFEGGFVADKRSSTQEFRDCLYDDHPAGIPLNAWIIKTLKSAVVFNTPAFWNCHGWKLGEYLAMGKAILSTTLLNDLPAPLIHGKHIHFVENDQQKMKEALVYILEHKEYRKKLEQGASEWWEQYGTPVRSLELLGIRN